LNEVWFLPLQLGIETDKIQMVPAWIASPEEIVKGIKALIFVVDLLIILSILFLDIFYTNLVDSMFRFNQLIQPLSRKYLRHSSAAFIRS
jgi:hypothetical protein